MENLVSDTGRTTWHGWLRLPPAGPVGALSFEFEAEDNLGNNATRITAANAFEIYSGNLPPLPAPGNLRGGCDQFAGLGQ